MIETSKNRFIILLLLLVTLPVTGQVYMTSKAKVHSVSSTGMGYDVWGNNTGVHRNAYGPSSAPSAVSVPSMSFYSTSSSISSGPKYSVSAPSIEVKTGFTTSASAITGGVTLADDLGLDLEGGISGPHKTGWQPPTNAPIGDIPWVLLVLAAAAFLFVKKKRSRGVEE